MEKELEELEEWDNFQIESDEVRQLILCYLTSKCEIESVLNNSSHKFECEKYHEEDCRRRNPFKEGKLIYSNKMCLSLLKNEKCEKLDNCNKCHNMFEIFYHPAKYRTSMCEEKCKWGMTKFCPLAHSKEQLRNGSIYLKESEREKVPILNQEFDLIQFKTQKCTLLAKHNEKQCLNFHSSKDKRRNTLNINYTPDICIYSECERICINGDFCLKSHNKVEMFYHPQKFKTKFCSHFNLNKPQVIENCTYGNYCSFAHTEDEIKIELIHHLNTNEDFFTNYFKTVTCPFTHFHEKAECVYSHNWQDYRRNPLKYAYKNTSCRKWNNKKTILNYNEGCPDEMFCFQCHGWKEEDFHPLNYKTKKCKNFSSVCNKKEFCPFYHQNEEKRKIPQFVKDDYKLRLKDIEKRKKKLDLLYFNEDKKKNMFNFISQRNNKSEIIQMNNTNILLNFNSNFNSNMNTNTNSNLNNSHFNYINNKQNSFGFTKNITPSSYSSNTSYNSFIFSDNENSQTKRKSYDSQFSAPSHKSSKSNFSNNSQFSLSDNITEGLCIGNINPDDSVEFNNIADKFNFKKTNFINQEDNNEINLENLEQNNNLLKQLFKDSDFIFNTDNNNGQKEFNNEDFISYLYTNDFKYLYDKIKSNKIEIKSLISYDDEKILSLIEEEKKDKFEELRSFLMKLEVNLDGEDLLKSINKDLNIEDDFLY